MNNLIQEFIEQGYEVEALDVSLPAVRKALKDGSDVNGLDLYAKLQNPKFRFVTKDDPAASFLLSDIISNGIQYTRSLIGEGIHQKSIEKRAQNADEFAISMHDVINKIKVEKNISSYRAIVDALNQENIPTYRDGGEWHLSTLQNLEKRWKGLGISSNVKKSHKDKPVLGNITKEDVKVFKSTVTEIITAVAQKKPLEGIDLFEEIKNPEFSFYTKKEQKRSRELSEALSNMFSAGRSHITDNARSKSIEVRSTKADLYAKNIFPIIEDVKSEMGISALRKIVKALNEKEIPTPNGGEWRVNTLQGLQKRWKELGITSDDNKLKNIPGASLS